MIYFMDYGEIKEQGTHSELLKNNGEYTLLYKKQKGLEEGYLEDLR